MYHTKGQDIEQIDSGLGDSFGSFDDASSVKTVQESLQKLDVNDDPKSEEAKQNEERIIQFLRQAYTPDEDNDTYLHLFIARGLEEKAMQLIEVCPQKELLDIQNNLGQTALHVATYVNFYKVAAQLVLNGADLDYVDKDGRNVFHLCAERGHLESLEAITRVACQTNQIGKLKLLMNERDFHGLTPFYLAVANQHQNICKKLTDMKVDVNLCDSKNGNSPLHEAVLDPEYSHLFIEFLVKTCNVEINYQNFAGVTPLHCAAGRGDTSLFAMLLLCGGNTNIVDISGNTPVVYGNQEILGLVSK